MITQEVIADTARAMRVLRGDDASRLSINPFLRVQEGDITAIHAAEALG